MLFKILNYLASELTLKYFTTMKSTKTFEDFETFKVNGLHYIKGGNDGDIGPGDKDKKDDDDKDEPSKPITILGIPIPGTGSK